MFNFQKLDVYSCSTTFLAQAAQLTPKIPRGYSSLADQLRRASLSVPLNIAEGNGRLFGDAFQHYAIARGSALECAAVLDACGVLGFVTEEELRPMLELLERVVAMLTKMARR